MNFTSNITLLDSIQVVDDKTLFVSFMAGGVMLLVGSYLLIKQRNQRLLKKNPPPPMAPWTMFETIRQMTGYDLPWFYLKTAMEKMNNVFTYRLPIPIPGVPMVVVTGDAQFAREILTDSTTTKPKTYQDFEPEGFGTIFTRNGPYWHARRKGVAPAFSANHVKRMNQVALEETEKWIQKRLIPCAKQGMAFDVAEEMVSITLNAISKTAFDYNLSEKEKSDFRRNEDTVLIEFVNRSMGNPLRKYFAWFLPERRRAIQAAKENLALAKRIIAKYRSNRNSSKGTIIDLIVNNPCYDTEDEMAADVLTFLVAGFDTTGYSLAFTLLELARKPEVQEQIQNEIADMSPDDWSKSKALQMAIKESMRLNPVSASGSLRELGRTFVTKEGWSVPKGSHVSIPFILVHRNPNVFEKADQFIPSRWENASKAEKDAFMIFSTGKQNCVGQSLANAELHCIIPKILSAVQLEVEDEGTTTYFLTLKPSGAMLKPKLVN